MPLFMDIHTVAGASPEDVAGAHEKDLATQAKHGVRYLKYWHDPKAGKIFCLVDAPTAEAAAAVHRDAHGLVADEIFPVEEHG
ncbi:MAG: nickel-binding protein [Myxococcales bacterium]